MTRKKHPRLWTPAITLLAGTGMACAFGLSHNWTTTIIADVVAICWAATLYFIGGQDTDLGAVIGQRGDERQQIAGWRAAQLSLVVVLAALIVACVIAAAGHHAFWPFEILTLIIAVTYFIGLGIYGMNNEAPSAQESEQAERPAIF